MLLIRVEAPTKVEEVEVFFGGKNNFLAFFALVRVQLEDLQQALGLCAELYAEDEIPLELIQLRQSVGAVKLLPTKNGAQSMQSLVSFLKELVEAGIFLRGDSAIEQKERERLMTVFGRVNINLLLLLCHYRESEALRWLAQLPMQSEKPSPQLIELTAELARVLEGIADIVEECSSRFMLNKKA
jgi:hypothetical protein